MAQILMLHNFHDIAQNLLQFEMAYMGDLRIKCTKEFWWYPGKKFPSQFSLSLWNKAFTTLAPVTLSILKIKGPIQKLASLANLIEWFYIKFPHPLKKTLEEIWILWTSLVLSWKVSIWVWYKNLWIDQIETKGN